MDKANLRTKWEKYCDTNALVDDTRALLNKYGHRNSEHGTCTVLDAAFSAKEPLIQKFITSAHYIGNLRIAIEVDLERELDAVQIRKFIDSFIVVMKPESILRKYTDANNKSITDYLMRGIKKGSVKNIDISKRNENEIAQFSINGYTQESERVYSDFCSWIYDFKYIDTATLQQNYDSDGIELKHGMKTSRAFNKMCVHYGLDKARPRKAIVNENGAAVEKTVYPYDKLFAQYADLVTAGTRHLYFIISLNPLDYLTMSIGPNWKSCHSISGGSYMGGCLSYMLDNTSMITFVVDSIDGNIHEKGKIYRQMFHYNNGFFIQNRMYPQGKDGAVDLYEKFRVIVQDEFTNIIGLAENNWTCDYDRFSGHYASAHEGSHYRDLCSHEDCHLFYPTQNADMRYESTPIHIGHESLCFYCGRGLGYHGQLSHSDCTIRLEDIVPDEARISLETVYFDWS